MKKFLTIVLLVVSVVMATKAQDLRVASYNIRMAANNDYKHGDGWTQRKDILCDFLKYEDFDVFGSQEVTWPQLQDIMSVLTDYDYVGVGRDDGAKGGEFCPVFYKKDRFKLLDSGTFWLSDTPEKVSRGWDAACYRVCSWAHLKDLESKKDIWFFNTHLDHVGVIARVEGAKLILSRIKSIAGDNARAIITGDFNVDQNNDVYKAVISDGLVMDCISSAEVKFVPSGTFNNWNVDAYTESHIDHIFVTAFNTKVKKFGVLTLHYWNQEQGEKTSLHDAPGEISANIRSVHTLSDHYPIVADITFSK